MRRIKPRERTLLHIKPDAEVYVSDDDPASLPDYNCLGSVMGIRLMFKPELWRDGTPIGFLRRVGLRPQATAAEKKIAVYKGNDANLWHVAKHIGGGWYESKCHEGLRIVHRPDCFLDDAYGPPENFWGFKGRKAKRKLRRALLRNAKGLCMGSAREKRRKAQAMVADIERVYDSKPPEQQGANHVLPI